MKIKFAKSLAYSIDYPTPIIKGVTSFKLNKLLFKQKKLTTNSSFFSLNGRSGLALITRHLKLKKGDTVLLPSYHCPALVEPFIWSGVTIRFYHLNKDLSVNLEDFHDKFDDTVKACLFVHYFGFPVDFLKMTSLVKSKKIAIIEDCAHAFYVPLMRKLQNPNSYFVVSCNKFFPCPDGSIVYGIKTQTLQDKLLLPSWFKDFKVLLNLFSFTAQTIEKVKKLTPVTGFSEVSKEIKDSEPVDSSTSFRYFNPDRIMQTCSRVSKFIVEHSNHKEIQKKRRENFQFLLCQLIDSNAGKPLFTELPEGVVPYVFPFILNKTQYFDDMRNAGLALFRWEEFVETDCQISQFYRRHLVQIPCHQDLTQHELDTIVSIVKKLTA